MFSGTSTGSLLSTAMALPSDETNPKDNLKGFTRPYKWASDATEIYTGGAKDIFRSNAMGTFVKVLYYIAFIAVFGGAFYLGGNRCYNREKKINAFVRTEEFLLERKENIIIERKVKKELLHKMAVDIKGVKNDVSSI